MLTKIDWLSFSLPIGEGNPLPSHRMADYVAQAVSDFSPVVFDVLFTGYEFEQRKGRAPYSIGWARNDNGVFIFAHPNLPHLLIEVTGKGCDAVSQTTQETEFVIAVQPRLTRIDIASDMLCETNPLDFAALRDVGRFKSHSEFVSESGTTAYVGSRTSDRYARVYRYNPPHERAHLLRAEHVLKGQQAKLTALAVLQQGLPAVTVALGVSFGWSHPSWTPDDVGTAILEVWRPERHAGKTMFWLNSAVAPAMRKLLREADFDPVAWIYENVVNYKPTDNSE